MVQHETSDGWTGQDAVVLDTPAATDGSMIAADQATPEGEVLAQVPDLDAAEPGSEPAEKPARSDGRIISQMLSTKLLVGGGVLLVLAAVIPWVLTRKVEPKGGKPPRPDADMAPMFSADTVAGQQDTPNMSYTPDMSFDHSVPDGPAFLDPSPSTGANASPKTPPWEEGESTDSAANQDQASRWNYEAKRPGVDRRAYPSQPPAIHAPPGPPPSPAAGNSTMPQLQRSPAWQDNPREARRPDWSQHQTYRQPMPQLNRAQAETNRPMSVGAGPYPPAEPGVARLEGVIEKPPVRTTYDRSRQSIH